MSTSFEKYQKHRLRSSYISAIMSIAFVLFLIGLLGLLVLNTKKISDYFKEQASMTIFLKDEVEKDERLRFETSIKNKEYTKSLAFISKDYSSRNSKERKRRRLYGIFGL